MLLGLQTNVDSNVPEETISKMVVEGIKLVDGLPYVYPKQAPDISTLLTTSI